MRLGVCFLMLRSSLIGLPRSLAAFVVALPLLGLALDSLLAYYALRFQLFLGDSDHVTVRLFVFAGIITAVEGDSVRCGLAFCWAWPSSSRLLCSS